MLNITREEPESIFSDFVGCKGLWEKEEKVRKTMKRKDILNSPNSLIIAHAQMTFKEKLIRMVKCFTPL
jgi:hypothetical protein